MKRLILFLVIGCTFSSNAMAQEIDRSALFEEGAKQYVGKQYEDAIVSWQKAYSLGPAAILLYNMALASGKLNNYTQAIAFANRAEIEPTEPLDPTTSAKNAANRQVWQMALRSSRATERLRRELDAKAGVDSGRPIGWMGWSGIGAGVLGVGALVTSGVFALQASDGLEKARATNDPDEHDSLKKTTQQQQILGQVLLYTGAGLLAVGTTLFILDRVGGEQAVSLRVGLNHVGIGGTF